MDDTKKILVVEDNDFVRMQIVKFLQDEGYQTLETTDGKAALEALDETISLAIVDVRMEPMDGFEFLNMIRSMEIKTPVVMITGDQTADLLTRAQKLNVAAVLMKPVQKDRLVKTVARTLQHQARAG